MRRSKAVPLGSGFVALAGLVATSGLVAGCDKGPEEQAYCADADGVIVEDDKCDEHTNGPHGPYFLWVGAFGRGLRPGQRLTGGTRLAANDPTARKKYGLPGSGRVGNGTVVTKGFGSGGG